MKLLQLSDIHGHIEKIKEIESFAQNVDVIILTGDITHFGNVKDCKKIIDIIKEFNKQIMAVPGNCDSWDIMEYLDSKGINLHERLLQFGEYKFTGLGGSLKCNTTFEFTEQEFDSKLNSLIEKQIIDNKTIIVTHQPPFGTKTDMVKSGNVGSKGLRALIEKTKPLLVLCGHIHESPAVDKINSTTIINPGPLKNGNFATIEINNENITCNLLHS